MYYHKSFPLAFPAIICQADLHEVFFSARKDECWLPALCSLAALPSCRGTWADGGAEKSFRLVIQIVIL